VYSRRIGISTPGAPFLALFARSGAFSDTLPTPNQCSVEFSFPPSPVVDPNQPRLPVSVGAVAAPPPILRRRHQSAHHRIAIHVPQFLNLFALAPQIEIIETTLSKPTEEFAPNRQAPETLSEFGRREQVCPNRCGSSNSDW
jgi:hypothetical protein